MPVAQEAPYVFREDVRVAMRDGVELSTNVYLPAETGAFPVILMRSPYGKPGAKWDEAERYAKLSMAMVVQDCRGRGKSSGLWDPFRHDAEDGFDTQEWVGAQPWSNGKIGTAGGSYLGWAQWASAPLGSRFLTTMVPMVPFGNVYQEITYPGGAFQLSLAFGWGASVGGISVNPIKLGESWRHLPLSTWDEQFGKNVFFLDDWVAHPTYDDYWKKRGIDGRYEAIKIPILNVGGWYDIFSKTTIDLVDRVRARSGDRLARRNQFVVIGPWGHGVGGQRLGELDFTEAAKMDLGAMQRQWFEYWLGGKETGVEEWPAYRLFVMGENVWRGESEWPLARAAPTRYYLRSGGKARTRAGDGVLGLEAPGEEPADTFVYDSRNPVPTRGGNNLVGPPAGPFDQASVEDREDVLVYTTPPLAAPVDVTGPITLVLYASSTAVDTDFTAKLVDVHEDGKAYNLCDGIIRARYRSSFTEPTLIEPGKVYPYEIDLWATSNLFKAGHRIRLEVSSSNFPRFDRNPNSGKPFGTDTELLTATQTAYHDAERASYLLLPVVPRG